jgi:carbamate kinase
MSRIAVVAVGGNSLIKDSQHQTVPDQYEAAVETMEHIASMVEMGYDVVITHGNGPQVGFILLRSDVARHLLHEVPLDSCVADTQGAIGYNFQMALSNTLRKRGIKKGVVTVVTQVVVDGNDPSFSNPTKPIGKFYSLSEAKERMQKDGWKMMEDAGRGWRRVVPSPIPREIVEQDAIVSLISQGFVVISVGGGGIPVVKLKDGTLKRGIEAVVDKDLASSLLASGIGAELFLISTAVDNVYLDFGTQNQRSIKKATVKEIRRYAEEGHFKPGSMLPKIEAAVEYLEKGGKHAIITSPVLIEDAIRGEAGTHIVN